jgi:hypothetical protein
MEEVRRDSKTFITRNFVIFTVQIILLERQSKEEETGGSYSVHERDERMQK